MSRFHFKSRGKNILRWFIVGLTFLSKSESEFEIFLHIRAPSFFRLLRPSRADCHCPRSFVYWGQAELTVIVLVPWWPVCQKAIALSMHWFQFAVLHTLWNIMCFAFKQFPDILNICFPLLLSSRTFFSFFFFVLIVFLLTNKICTTISTIKAWWHIYQHQQFFCFLFFVVVVVVVVVLGEGG